MKREGKTCEYAIRIALQNVFNYISYDCHWMFFLKSRFKLTKFCEKFKSLYTLQKGGKNYNGLEPNEILQTHEVMADRDNEMSAHGRMP